MEGTIRKVVKGRFFFITGEDGKDYFSPFEQIGRQARRGIWKGNHVTFDTERQKEGEKTPRAVNVIPDRMRNPHTDMLIPPLDERFRAQALTALAREMYRFQGYEEGVITTIKGGNDIIRDFCKVTGVDGEEFFAPFLEFVEYDEVRKKIRIGQRVMFIPEVPKKPEYKNRVATVISLV